MCRARKESCGKFSQELIKLKTHKLLREHLVSIFKSWTSDSTLPTDILRGMLKLLLNKLWVKLIIIYAKTTML